MKFLLFCCTVFFAFFSFAQVEMGQWRFHVATNKAIDVVGGNNKVFAAYENGLLEYELENNEKSLWTKVNGLSDIDISKVFYSKNANILVIGYKNGNLDILAGNEITNVPGLFLANIPGDKKIYNFFEKDKFIYVSTGMGILKLDPYKKEIKDTYYPLQNAEPLLDLAIHNDSLYALTPSKLLKAYLLNPLIVDYSQWQNVVNLPLLNSVDEFYSEIEFVNSNFYLLKSHISYGLDTVYNVGSVSNLPINNFGYTSNINHIKQVNNQLTVDLNDGLVVYVNDQTMDKTYYTYGFGSLSNNASCFYSGKVFIADGVYGLVQFNNEFSAEVIGVAGMPKKTAYALDWKKGKLSVAGGMLDELAPSFSKAGVYTFEEEKWSIINPDTDPKWQASTVWDIISVAINSNNTNQIAAGSASQVALSIINNGKVDTIFTKNNSLLEEYIGRVSVKSIEYDNDGNLWVLNDYAVKPLKVFSTDNTWYNMNTNLVNETKWGSKLIIDNDGNKWFCQINGGVTGYNHNQTISNTGDDKMVQLNIGPNSGNLPSNNVNTIAIDLDNELWIGTESGFAILYNPTGAFDASPGDYNAQRIKIEFEGNVEYVLGNTNIKDIEVDGGNRKWIATANAGIVLLSSDGSEIIKQFTKENSPLISNNIFDIEIDNTTGELFIVTDVGLVSYRSDASEGVTKYDDVNVFPNPVRPNFNGLITIQGIKYDSDVKITDAGGNLVYSTTSNGGTATWNGKTLKGEDVSSGVYLIWTAPNEGKGRKVGKVVVIR